MNSMITETPQNEFWYHVANQPEIPIAGEIDKSLNVEKLVALVADFPSDSEQQTKHLKEQIKSDPNLIDILRTLVGVSDKRMYLELSYIFSRTRLPGDDHTNILNYTLFDVMKHPLSYYKSLVVSPNTQLAEKSVEIIMLFLKEKRLFEIIEAFRRISAEQLVVIVEKLIVTKEVQQAEAKRRGHGAEFALAALLHDLGCEMIPEDRWQRPMGFRDPNVDRISFQEAKKKKGDTWSFDLILKDGSENCVFIQSLIHTSDPGQYGVNKSDETVQIRQDLDSHNQANNTRKELWGLVDGVGFCENKKDTIDKMLNVFDCFVQMKSLYKAGLHLHKLGLLTVKGIRFNTQFYTNSLARSMYEKYASDNIQYLTSNDNIAGRHIQAGMATLVI